MKKLLNLILVFAVLATFGGLATVNAATTTNSSKSNGSYKGKVSQVDPKTRTFTLTAKGKAYKFVLPKGAAQPKVGEVVDVTYTGALSATEPAMATTVNGSKSNADARTAASPTPNAVTKIKSTTSNASLRTAASPTPTPTPTPKAK